ncbi:MAG: hypothetical protein ACR2NU_10660 [Aeoliella sp.]
MPVATLALFLAVPLFMWSVAGSVAAAADTSSWKFLSRVNVTQPNSLDWTFAVVGRSVDNLPAEWLGKAYRSKENHYEIFAPDDVQAVVGEQPLVIFVPSRDESGGWKHWQKICREQQMLFAGIHLAGDDQPTVRRVRILFDVLDDVHRRHRIDPDRTYIAGVGGGARIACQVAYATPRYFGGCICIGGGDIPPQELWRQRQLAARLSGAFLASSREEEQLFAQLVFQPLLDKKKGRSRVWIVENQKRQMPSTNTLDDVLLWIDSGVQARRELASRYPSTRFDNNRKTTRDQQAALALVDARRRLEEEETEYDGFMQLEGIVQRWPHTTAAKDARAIVETLTNQDRGKWQNDRQVQLRHDFLDTKLAFDQLRAKTHGHGRPLRTAAWHAYPEEEAIFGQRLAIIIAQDEPPALADYNATALRVLNRLGSRAVLDRHGRVGAISLSGSRVTSEQLQKLIKQLDGLEEIQELDLSAAQFRDNVLSPVGELTSLRAVNLTHAPVTNGSLSHLVGLKNLETLSLAYSDVSNVRHVGSLLKLRTLLLGSTKIDDDSLRKLSGLRHVVRLSLFSTGVTNKGVAHLRKFPELTYLNLADTKVDDESANDIASFESLTELVLDDLKLTNASVGQLSQLPSLKRLSLQGTTIDDGGLTHIRTMKQLDWINVRGTRVTAGGIDALRIALPNCKVEWDGDRDNTLAAMREQLIELRYIHRFRDQYRLQLRKFQRRYLGDGE